MRRTTVALPFLLLTACAVPDGSLQDTELQPGPWAEPAAQDEGDAERVTILGLERVDSGPMVADTVVEFLLVTRGDYDGLVQWSASGGDLQTAGIEARWLLPNTEKASLRVRLEPRGQDPVEAEFLYQVITDKDEPTWAVSPLATGLVDPTPDTITGCRMVIDSNDTPHIVYRSGTHLQLWYASFDGTDWDIDFVDGPGFDVGGLVANDFNLTTTSTGTPHVVYRYQNFDDVRYATRSASTWTREQVDTAYPSTDPTSGRLAIDLDPINSNRATVAYTYYDSIYGDHHPVVAYRSGANNWIEDSYPLTTWGNYVAGGMKFTASGVAWLTFDTGDARVVNWSATAGFFDEAQMDTSFGDSSYMPVELDAFNQPIVLSDEGIFHRVASVWQVSDYEASHQSYYDLAVDGSGEPRMGVNHGGDLELIETDSEGYWQYSAGDEAIDSTFMGVAVDSSNNTHACYIKDGQLWFY